MTDALSWIEAFAATANALPLTIEERDAVLALAGVAAHSSERTAAPLACWIAGAAGLSPANALELAQSVTAQFPLEERNG